MFNFDDAQESKNAYLEPGVYTVKTTQITDGTAQTGAPFIEWTLEDKTGATASNRFYLVTEVKQGSEKSAWDITKAAIVNAIAAINNTTFDDAKTKLPAAKSPAELSAALSKLTVGRPFDVRLNGKEIAGKDGKSNWIKAEFNFAKGAIAPANSNKLTFDAAKHIKKLTPAPTNPGFSSSSEVTW